MLGPGSGEFSVSLQINTWVSIPAIFFTQLFHNRGFSLLPLKTLFRFVVFFFPHLPYPVILACCSLEMEAPDRKTIALLKVTGTP